MIRALIFDLDGTLLDRESAVERFLASQYSRYGGDAAAYSLFRDRFRVLDDHGRGNKRVLYDTLVREFRFTGTPDELHHDFEENFPEHCQPFPQCLHVLQALRASRYKLGIVTNGSVQMQRATLKASGLISRVDEVLISAQEGIRKPDRLIFVRAAERLGVDPSQCCFVGDDPVSDIEGSRSAGMKPIWMKGTFRWPEQLARCEMEISNISELLTMNLIRGPAPRGSD